MAATVRVFTGKVSKAALENAQGKLVLEHYERISHSLSRLLEDHSAKRISDPDSFINLIERCERVNITTDQDNHNARRAAGNYQVAGIILIDWNEVPMAVQAALWRTKLRNQVANAADYAP